MFDNISRLYFTNNTTFQFMHNHIVKASIISKVSLDLPKGLWSYGGFNLTGSGYPQIFSAPSGKLWFSATGSRHNEHIHMKFGM